MRAGSWRQCVRAARALVRACRGRAIADVAGAGRDVLMADHYDDDPIAASYAHAARPIVVKVPMERCRGLWFAGFACVPGGSHPYVETLMQHARGETDSYEDSPLREYFERWRPSSAADALGLADDAFVGIEALRRVPAAAAMAPWWPTRDLASFALAIHASTRRENEQATASARDATQLDAAGSHLFGPVSGRKGAIEFDRCIGIFRSVLCDGFLRDSTTLDGDVRGQALVRDDGSYAVLILSGQHRVAAAAAIDLNAIPIRFHHGAAVGSSVVHRSDVRHWPAVRSGIFTEVAALAVFDRLFAGHQPWA